MAPSPNPTLADFKALAAALPPSERVVGAEVADVLSAVVARISHGSAIFDAAAEGGVAVYEFLHNEIADLAKSNGDPQPEKGALLTQPAPAGAVVTQAAPSIDYDKLAAAMLKAQQAAQAPAAEEDTTTSEAASSEEPGNTGGIL